MGDTMRERTGHERDLTVCPAELPERAAAAPFVEVLARAFFGTRADAQFVFARVGLSDLYTGLARERIAIRGGRVVISTP